METKQIFTIYRDNELDKAYYYKAKGTRILRGAGRISYKALEATLDAFDQWVQSAQ